MTADDIKVERSTIYRVEITVPEEVAQRFRHLREYELFSAQTSNAVEHSGQDAYSGVIEWGEAPTIEQCAKFVLLWKEQIRKWQQFIIHNPLEEAE